MFFLKSAFCRIYQTVFRIALPILPYREPEIADSSAKLGEILKKEKVKSVLIVTDNGIIGNGLIEPITKALKASKTAYTTYDKTRPNPTVDNVEEAYSLYRENDCDCIISVGGGSSMDCAKAVGARIAYPKRTVGQMKGILRVLRPLPTLIAIPTTAGTGSEVTLAAVITDSEKRHKYALMSFPLIPHYAVLDPELTYSLPQGLTATTGMDALTHAVEAYIGRSTTKETRRLALEAVKLVFENIETAYQDGKNRTARENMLQAAYKAGVAFSKSYVGYIHAVAPDYILCERSVKVEFISEAINQIKRQYGENPLKNKDYGRIINEKHFNRLCGLIDGDKVVFGGEVSPETCQIAPTVMDGVTYGDAVMGEEIFGPVMPIIAFDNFESLVKELKNKPMPLALYIFLSDKKHINTVTATLSYGGGCVNDVVIHLATSEMGFGGVGESGMGSYHGKDGFDAFSHYKSIVDKKVWLDLPMRYQPYKSKLYETLLHIFLK